MNQGQLVEDILILPHGIVKLIQSMLSARVASSQTT